MPWCLIFIYTIPLVSKGVTDFYHKIKHKQCTLQWKKLVDTKQLSHDLTIYYIHIPFVLCRCCCSPVSAMMYLKSCHQQYINLYHLITGSAGEWLPYQLKISFWWHWWNWNWTVKILILLNVLVLPEEQFKMLYTLLSVHCTKYCSKASWKRAFPVS